MRQIKVNNGLLYVCVCICTGRLVSLVVCAQRDFRPLNIVQSVRGTICCYEEKVVHATRFTRYFGLSDILKSLHFTRKKFTHRGVFSACI